jgi:hypothetical protein
MDLWCIPEKIQVQKIYVYGPAHLFLGSFGAEDAEPAQNQGEYC